MTQKTIDRKLNEARVFLDWYITRLVLNGKIDGLKCGKHPIPFQSAEEMKNNYVDTKIYHDWQDGLNSLHCWQKIHKVKYYSF